MPRPVVASAFQCATLLARADEVRTGCTEHHPRRSVQSQVDTNDLKLTLIGGRPQQLSPPNPMVEVPPAQDARAQDQSVQNAEAPSFLQTFGLRN
jgi:hypothetical protein